MRSPMSEAERVTVRSRTSDTAVCDAAGSGAIIFGNDASDCIRRPTRCRTHHDCNRPGRIGLCLRDARNDRQRRGTRGQMYEFAAGKLRHVDLRNDLMQFPSVDYGIFGSHSGLMPANLITVVHFSISFEIILPKAAGAPPSTVPPNSAIRATIFGSARPADISLLSLSIISAGVPLGAPSPSQPTPS